MARNVLVTGGNGFIAVHIIVLLLQNGYAVTTTVRSESKTTYLRNKFASAVSEGQLRFAVVEDITVPGAFDEVIKGNKFDALYSSRKLLKSFRNDVTKDLLMPAIKGTTEILKSIKAHSPSVKRVVIASSFAAILDLDKGNRPGYVYSEKDLAGVQLTQSGQMTFEEAQKDPGYGYCGSKALAEKAAWEFIETEKPGFDLATICPPTVTGPALQEITDLNKLNTSSAISYNIWTDVRDVAIAHVAAMEKPEAGNQRFFITEGNYNIGQIADFVWRHYSERAQAKGVPKSTPEDGYPPEGNYHADNSKSKEILGIKYTPFETTLRDQMEQFIALEKELGVE
ncbi:methylglyoxal reductase (NADPH-dependent) gre2 [Ceratobasidium sp. 392]|nr:methylglyoxal reductase (NADPH-dependent) gre2 [Ceratobasidium sp. 392]